MFRATMCPSSEETTVVMQHSVLVILCGLVSGVQGGIKLRINILRIKCAPSWLYLQYYTEMHGQ